MAKQLFTFRVQRAVCNSTLPAEMRHLLLTMAALARGADGVGLSGQQTIARAMGVTDRTVRRLLAELPADSPILVDRRPRFDRHGRGRTSDEYRLVIVDQPDTNVRLVEANQPDAGDRLVTTTNRKPVHDQPDTNDTTNRTPTSGDHRSDQLSDHRRDQTPSPRRASRRQSKRSVRERPADWKPNEKHRERATANRLDAESQAEAFREWHDSKGNRFADWDAAFFTWLRKAVTFRDQSRGSIKAPGAVDHDERAEHEREHHREWLLDEAKRGRFGQKAQAKALAGTMSIDRLERWWSEKRKQSGLQTISDASALPKAS
jgi:hypothetical protein